MQGVAELRAHVPYSINATGPSKGLPKKAKG
jgi:hypothetical protein